MKNKESKNKQFKKGFTLIELLVAILIVGILAAIALPQYKMAVLKSRFATIKNLTRSVLDAQRRYYLLHNEYAANFGGLDVEMPRNYISKTTNGGNEYYYYDFYICFTSKEERVSYCKLRKNINDYNGYVGYQIYHAWGGNISQALALCYVLGVPLDDYRDKFCQMETGRKGYFTLGPKSKSYYYHFL